MGAARRRRVIRRSGAPTASVAQGVVSNALVGGVALHQDGRDTQHDPGANQRTRHNEVVAVKLSVVVDVDLGRSRLKDLKPFGR